MSSKLKMLALAFVLRFFFALPAAGQQQPTPGFPPIPIDATEEQVRQAVALVRAGPKLTPKSWPNGARVAVCLSFDVDNELLARTAPLPVPLSQGEYGATTGLPRVLDLLDRHSIPASFYIPAMSAALHPQMIQDILQRKRHEIGVHGWMHENLPQVGDAAKEEQLLTQSIEYLTKATGKRPVGFRAPSWAFSQSTLDQIRKAGFLYDSSFMAMDEPYELLANGQKTGMIELPINWIADDYPYYEPQASGSLPDPQLVFEVYKGEFDMAYQEHTMFILTMHPHITGHRSRIAGLERLVIYMKSKPGVWFATLEQVADYVKAQEKEARK
jgi:peptidoglycan/xylan/chitin deacetylase (PgdA/CDA1 family)